MTACNSMFESAVAKLQSRVVTATTSAEPAPALTAAETAILDNAAWSSLTGPHAEFASGNDLVLRYPEDVSPFLAVRDWANPEVWDALTDVLGPGAEVRVPRSGPQPPQDWEVVGEGAGVQLVETPALHPRADDEVVELGASDVPDMLDIVARNEPGPFRPRTYELGRYIGIRRNGRLVAMAGERLHPQGWTEISAVSTDAEYRRQGLASRLVLDVAHHIQQRGDRVLMHAAAANAGAIAAYEKLGFAVRRRNSSVAVRIPA